MVYNYYRYFIKFYDPSSHRKKLFTMVTITVALALGLTPEFLKLDKLYQFIKVMPRISAATTDPYLYLAHLVRSLKNLVRKNLLLFK